MKQKYYSNGKLLLTGEYLVLKGALSIAIPTKYGQDLTVSASNSRMLKWEAYENDTCWLSIVYQLPELKIISASDIQKAKFLQKLLKASLELAETVPDTLIAGATVATTSNFAINWGLGTSSTLINNLGQWFKINPYQLLSKVSRGSGYDIACASAKNPISYRLEGMEPSVKDIVLNANAFSNVYFIYLGQKQKSEPEVERFLKSEHDYSSQVQLISSLSEDIGALSSVTQLEDILSKHEEIISELLYLQPIQKRLFPDFKGTIKSLGAWGGDFIMAVGTDFEYIRDYFTSKELTVIIPFHKMILH